MISWMKIIHVGDIGVMVPAAAAIMAYLVAGRAWRMAWRWCLLFILGIGLVAASKIAFLGWGYGIRALDFKALSGHATSATAVIPVTFYLLLQRAPSMTRAFGVLVGIACGVVLGVLLVVLNEHTASEAIAGCLVGATVSLVFIRGSRPLPSFRLKPWLLPFSVIVCLWAWHFAPPPLEYWMMRVALYLSGHDTPYNWTTWQLDT